MDKLTYRYFVGDFETTVYENQTYTEVWASASVELYTEDVSIFHSIDEQFNYFISLNSNIICYYHNLKFDGSFYLSYLLNRGDFKQAYTQSNPNDINSIKWIDRQDMKNNTFQYSISNMGQWYTITIKVNNHIIQFRDSLKLLPFSLKRIGKSFDTKHKKLDMEYMGFRYAGCTITDEEKQYISNDVLVIKEALEIMFNEKHDKLTIGSCCLSEFRKGFYFKDYQHLFPDLYEIKINEEIYGSKTAGDYINKSYRGGWCYLVKGKENQIKHNGTTADVNSLYPSMMSSESGNYYPVGRPYFWHGNYIPDTRNSYFFIRIKTRFKIKKNKLPFIQIKNNLLYRGNECLETSDIFDSSDGKYYSKYRDYDGSIKIATATMTMTMTDYYLFLEHYDVFDFEILDGCYFESEKGLFDEYINKYKQIKMTSKGAKRELAKLFLNNLYGKMASNTNSSFKVAYLKDNGALGYFTVIEHNKKGGYIPIGSAITSYARNFTIRAAQQNYYGVNKAGFIYADTDSIHCDLSPEEIKGINIHETKFCCWKLESSWDLGFFVRQKTYIERVVAEDLKPTTPYYNMKCAGMPERCKDLFISSISDDVILDNLTENEIKFLQEKRDITDFKKGLIVPSKLMPKNIKGGILLVDTSYEMR